jgi:hypothetical protein
MTLSPARERRARPGLAVAAGLAMLAIATVLSALLVRQRHSFSLADRLAPPGWAVSFMPPTGWTPAEQIPLMPGYDGYRFIDPGAPPGHKQLWVGRIRDSGAVNAEVLCRQAMLAFFPRVLDIGPWRTLGLVRAVPLEAASLGPLPAVQAVSHGTGDLFLVGALPHASPATEAYVLEYHREGALDARDLMVCRTVADSFAPTGSASGEP